MDIDKPSMELYLHGGYVDCGNDVWRMQGSLGVSRAIGDKHLVAHSNIHNGCSTYPRHTSCMTNIVSTQARELHCHSPEQVQLNKRNSQFTLGGKQNAFAERKNLINNHVTQCNTSVIISNVHCQKKDATRCQQSTNHLYAQQAKLATQFRCSRQKKMATKPNCGQQQQVEADGKQICTLQKDSAERLDDNNAQATPQVTVVPCVDRYDKPHAKRTHRQTSNEIQKNSRPDISIIDTDGMEKRHGFRLYRKPVRGGRICVSIDEHHNRNRSSSASVPYGVSNL
ncbi:hypothetical protein Tco_1291644 [Tanacetum coccineum]